MIHSFDVKKVPSILQVGGKAKVLIETKKAGFPVPEGIVLSVDFFESWLSEIKESEQFLNTLKDTTKENCDKVKSLAMILKFDKQQKEMFDNQIMILEDKFFAVRSSSPEEDLKGVSFAGMYETYLGKKIEDLEETVALAFSSCFDYRVMSYKKQKDIPLENTSIAVIIQRQIASEVSGVGFSLNPLNNAYDEVVINASFGLGEAIVSGIVTPDMYIYDIVDKKIIEKKVNIKEIELQLNPNGGMVEKENINKEQPALLEIQIIELSSLIKRCEQHYNFPVDVEWAYEADQLYLLQARPITTHLPFFEELLTEPGETKRFYIDLLMMTQGIDESMSIMGMDIWKKLIYSTKSGLLSTQINGTAPVVNGREYLSVTAYQKVLGKKTGRKALDTYDGNIKKIFENIDLESHSFEGKPEGTKGYIGRSLKKALLMLPDLFKAVYSDQERIVKDYLKSVDIFTAVIENLDCKKTIDELVNETMTAFDTLMDNVSPIFAGMLSQQKLKKIFKNDDLDTELIALNMDLDGNPTSEMGNLLFLMACSSEFREIKSRAHFILKIKTDNFPVGFMTHYGKFMRLYSSRGFKEIDVATKRIYEDVGMLYDRLIQINPSENQNLIVKSKREEAYNKLLQVAKDKGQDKKFIKAAERLKATFGYREYPKYMLVNAFSILHKICLEIAGKWVTEGRLEEACHIFDLTIEEITKAQKDEKFDLMFTREKNLRGYKTVESVTQWPLVIDSRGKIHKAKIKIENGDIIGDSIAPGKVVGKAKVLHTPYEKSIIPGEILIVRATEPSWTPIFTNASGVVMEIGGPLQHGSIIAREYGIPCVSGLVGIMDLIKDGDLIEVDGNRGTVRLLEEI
ncbi:MAG: hypothetical protein JEZ08_11850 [Clostridiales bacterium]|nr:hypothetical protein [Clostridiales bacterium]